MRYVFDPTPPFSVPIRDEDAVFPVRRIFCVGRNYEAHAAEMGDVVDREAPWYFTKSSANGVLGGATIPFPQGTQNYHYEMELAAYIGAEAFQVSAADAGSVIFGYGCGLDMTRRDRQQDGKDHRRPWDVGKDVENGSVLASISRTDAYAVKPEHRISLEVNGETRQDATLADLVWSVEELIGHLSHLYRLLPGDVILTGTPAGVGPVVVGDVITGQIDGLDPVRLTLAEPE